MYIIQDESGADKEVTLEEFLSYIKDYPLCIKLLSQLL